MNNKDNKGDKSKVDIDVDNSKRLVCHKVENFFAMECSEDDFLTMELVKVDKDRDARNHEVLGFAHFPLKKLARLPNITHSLEINFANQQAFTYNLKVATLHAHLNFFDDSIGVLEIKLVEALVEA